MSVFANVAYFLVDSFPHEERGEIASLLDEHGARAVDTVAQATHIISNSDRVENPQSVPSGAHIVTPLWVTRSITSNSLQNPKIYSTDPYQLFSGVIACAAEMPPNDITLLHTGISALGGQWRVGLTKDVTHVFSINRFSGTHVAAQQASNIKVLVPHWFDDSVKLGCRDLPSRPYEWPEPAILKEDVESNDVSHPSGSLERDDLRLLGMDVPEEIPARDVWGERRILISPSLEIDAHRRQAIEGAITRSAGKVVRLRALEGDGSAEEELKKVKECDILITKWRQGAAYRKAVRMKKTIGSVKWLFDVQSTGILVRPMDQFLHYPPPNGCIEGFNTQVITVTNYTGPARDYLKCLIAAMGGAFTPTLSSENTVVIAAHLNGAKVRKAQDWSIPIVSHYWLEDCFSRWTNLTTSKSKYIEFPPGLDFSETLAQNGLTKEVELLTDDDLTADVPFDDDSDSHEGPTDFDAPMPPGTANSARDASEVAGIMDVDGDDDEDVREPQEANSSSPDLDGITNAAQVSQTTHNRIESQPSTPFRSARERTLSEKARFAMTSQSPKVSPKVSPKSHLKNGIPSRVVSKGASEESRIRTQSRRSNGRVHIDAEASAGSSETPYSSKASDNEMDIDRDDANEPSQSPSTYKRSPTYPRKIPYVEVPSPSSIFKKPISRNESIRLTGNEYSSPAKSSKSHQSANGVPSSSPLSTGGMEEISSSSQRSKRTAATNAANRLKEVMPDVVRFENEKRRKSWRTSGSTQDDYLQPSGHKTSRKRNSLNRDEDEEGGEPANVKGKRRKVGFSKVKEEQNDDARLISPSPSGSGKENKRAKSTVFIMSTGCDISKCETQLKKLGGKTTMKEYNVTHLIVEKFVRTEKFFKCIVRHPHVVTMDWLEDSIEAGEFLPEAKYHLVDKEAEGKWGFNLRDSLDRAHERDIEGRGPLFRGHTFFLSQALIKEYKSHKLLKDAIEVNGGTCKVANPLPDTLKSNINFFVTVKGDAKGRELFGKGCPIYDKEFVLMSAIRQQLEVGSSKYQIEP